MISSLLVLNWHDLSLLQVLHFQQGEGGYGPWIQPTAAYDPCLWWSMVSISYCFWCFWSVSVGCLWFPSRLERFHDGFWGASWSKHRGCRSFRGLELPGYGGLINRFRCRFMPWCISFSLMPFQNYVILWAKVQLLLFNFYACIIIDDRWWVIMINYDHW